MRTAPKVALSLLISILLFSGLAVAAYIGLFNILETRFYQPVVMEAMDSQLDSVSKALSEFHSANTAKFASFVAADPVRKSLLPNQSAQDIFDRTNLAGALLAEMPGLSGIRIIDSSESTSGTRRIHFSTFDQDILKKEDFSIAYELYGKNPDELDYSIIARADKDAPLLVQDGKHDRFVYAFPFYDAYSAWRGTAVFYLATRSAVQDLFSRNILGLSDDLVPVSSPEKNISGVVLGMPRAGRNLFTEAIIERWARNDFETSRLVSTEDSGWILLSRGEGNWGYTGQLVEESLFVFPQPVRVLFLTLSFLTIFLVIFLLFNLKQDEIVVIRDRIRRFQVQLLSELVENREEDRWVEIRKNLEFRRHDVSSELRKSFGKGINKRHGEEIEALLEKSWEEILSAIGRQETRQSASLDTENIRLMLEQVLQNNAISLNLTGVPAAKSGPQIAQAPAPQTVKRAPPKDSDLSDEIEEVEELEEMEELDEAEAVEEIGEAEAVEELEEAEAVEELDEAEAVEEIGEAEAVEELGEVEAVEELGEDEAVEELGEVEAVKEIDEVEAVEELGEVEAVKEIDEVEALQRAADLEFFNVNMDLYPESETVRDFENEEPLPEAEPEEVEYLEGEWEPELLEIATEDELANFIEDQIPDNVLIYNFDEIPALDTGFAKQREPLSETNERADEYGDWIPESFAIGGMDFSSLDSSEAEHVEEVEYLSISVLDGIPYISRGYPEAPVYEFLEVIGTTEPENLLELDITPASDSSSIITEDGLYIISPVAEDGKKSSVDPDFRDLVNSVLK